MAQQKRGTPQKAVEPERAPSVKPLPFPGESPTVSLAMAAGQMYGLPAEEEKPARSPPKRRSATKKKPARSAATRRSPAKTKAKSAGKGGMSSPGKRASGR